MPSDPVARVVRNLIRLERLSNTIAAGSAELYGALFEQIVQDLQRIDPTAPSRARFRRLRTEKFIKRAAELLKDFEPVFYRHLQDQLALVGREQALFAEDLLIATLGTEARENVVHTSITQQRLRAILNSDPFEGRILKDHVKRIDANTRDRIAVQVRIGMTNEESIPDIVRRIRGTQAGYIRQDPNTGVFVPRGTPGARVRPRFVGGVLSRSTRETEALVRTAVTHISNEGMLGTFADNEDILASVRFVATLDSRTTLICMGLDGTLWPVGSDEIEAPPLHWNCRSILAPEVDWEGLSLPEPPDSTRSARDPVTGKVERVPSSVFYEQWLRSQPVAAQNEILGPGRARLFRSGKITLADLVRGDRSTVPLSELREKVA